MEMNQQQQVNNNSFPSPDVPLKRKRGRPRKDKSQNSGKSVYVPPKRDQSQSRAENAPVPPGFEKANGNQSNSVEAVNDTNDDSMVGQVVTGVIESAFGDGYMLSVRIGQSGTRLTGVVFKPGKFLPVSAENDVAPGLQMIRRIEVPFPSSNPGHQRRGREKSEHHSPNPSNGSPRSNQLARVRAKPMPIVAVQSPHPVGARGTLVPVVLQPVNLSNGATPAIEAPPVASKPAHLAASKSKPGPAAQPIIQETVPRGGSQTDSGSASQQPFEELVSVAKRMKGSPESVGTHTESGASSTKILPKDSGVAKEQVEDLSKPLLVKPLQAIQSGFSDQSATMSHVFPERRAGKMTELLMAVQENLMERQRAESQHQDFKNPEN